ncbi:MAG: hypothetical protein JSV51_04845 [Candidatus Bathyarchaeota archaeon]|nr:MAG: hypothetical protein JSV51_04845 [Candidatus Bathyarchaeota archaeon]
MDEVKDSENRFVRHGKSEAKKDRLSYSDRIGNVAGIVVTILVTSYFIAHQMWATGFFTSKFGLLEMFLFYGLLIYQAVPATLKALFGRRNFARLFEIFGAVFGTVVLAWFFVSFPFDFTYFANVLPSFLRFLLQWISNDIIRVLMVIGLIAAPGMAIYLTALYMFVRNEL